MAARRTFKMATLGENIIGALGLPPFFDVANADAVSIDAPENRKGDAIRTWVRSLSGFQKSAAGNLGCGGVLGG